VAEVALQRIPPESRQVAHREYAETGVKMWTGTSPWRRSDAEKVDRHISVVRRKKWTEKNGQAYLRRDDQMLENGSVDSKKASGHDRKHGGHISVCTAEIFAWVD